MPARTAGASSTTTRPTGRCLNPTKVLEFWGWHHLLGLGMGLARTVAGVRAGTTYVPRSPGARLLPTYAEVARMVATRAGTPSK